MITSCLECRRRKLKCDKVQPACTNCTKFSRECNFLSPSLDPASQKKLNEIKDKMGTLERTLEQDIARRKAFERKSKRSLTDLPADGSDSDDGPVPEDEKGLEVTPLAMEDGAYDDDMSEDVYDLGFRVGKFRMTDRLGGLYRPKLAEELVFALVSDSKKGTEQEPPLRDDQDSFLEPGPNFIAPGSGFIFGSMLNNRTLLDYLQPKGVVDQLVRRYHSHVHFIGKVVHWPSFQLRYEEFWRLVQEGIEPMAPLQALVFSICFAAVVTMTNEEVQPMFSASQRTVLVHFQSATEMALGRAHFLRTTKFETLQALIIYLIPMCRNEISRAHSVLVGAAIRLGECFGLHRDPVETFGSAPIEAHVRRIAWFTLCYLDFKTAETQGPRPTIKREDYDTKLPWNVDDVDLLMSPTNLEEDLVLEDKDGWTDMTLSRMRFECAEMHRVVWFDRIRLDKKKISITHALTKIEAFRKAMEEKYAYLNMNVPIQRYARYMLDILTLRMHIMILHKFHSSTSTRIPDRLRQIMINSGTTASESAVALDADPMLTMWKWFSPAHQQWHILFLLLCEVFLYPNRKEADRIWKCADYVFEPDLSLNRVQKARSILGAMRDRAKAYKNLRRLKEPVSMRNRLNTNLPARAKARGPEMILPPRKREDHDDQAYHSHGSSTNQSFDWHALIEQQNREKETQFPRAGTMNSNLPGRGQDGEWTMDAESTGFLTRQHGALCNVRARPVSLPNGDPPIRSDAGHGHKPLALSTTPNHHQPSNVRQSHNHNSETWPPAVSVSDSRWQTHMVTASHSPPTLVNSASEASGPSPPPLHYNTAVVAVNHQQIPVNPDPYGNADSISVRYQVGPHGLRGPASSMPQTAMSEHNNATSRPNASTNGTTAWQLQQPPTGSLATATPQDLPMLDIDWGEWDKLFPIEMNRGDLDVPLNFEQTR